MTEVSSAHPQPVLAVRGLNKQFRHRTDPLTTAARRLRGLPLLAQQAVRDVSFDLQRGQTLGLVGESGCGKTTLGRSLLRLVEPDSGQVTFGGTDLLTLSRVELRRLRPRMQIIFQDPTSALNPRHRVDQIIGRALEVGGVKARERRARVGELLAAVGLPAETAGRYPHQLSGGQKQRVCVGRAVATGPDFVVADEPVSSLDVSIQAQILNLLADLQARQGMSLLLISHDLSVVAEVSHRMAVMYAGCIVEMGPSAEIVGNPRHPYTETLLEAIPRLRGHRLLSAAAPPRAEPDTDAAWLGCPYFTRCDLATDDVCRSQRPAHCELGGGHSAACHLVR